MRVRDARRQNRRRTAAFTLVELLVVIGIIGLLLVIAMTTISNIGQATQVEISANQLKGTIHLARQWAITQRRTTHVVFPRNVPADRIESGGTVIASNVNFRAYGVYDETIDPQSGARVIEPVREWTFLSPGVFFDRTPRPTVNIMGLHASVSNYRSTNPGVWSDQPTLTFAPNGSLASKSTAPEVFLNEGFLAPGATEPTIQDRGVQISVQVYQWTGLPQFNRHGED